MTITTISTASSASTTSWSGARRGGRTGTAAATILRRDELPRAHRSRRDRARCRRPPPRPLRVRRPALRGEAGARRGVRGRLRHVVPRRARCRARDRSGHRPRVDRLRGAALRRAERRLPGRRPARARARGGVVRHGRLVRGHRAPEGAGGVRGRARAGPSARRRARPLDAERARDERRAGQPVPPAGAVSPGLRGAPPRPLRGGGALRAAPQHHEALRHGEAARPARRAAAAGSAAPPARSAARDARHTGRGARRRRRRPGRSRACDRARRRRETPARRCVNADLLARYARLVVESGANVQPGMTLIVGGDVEQADYVRAFVRAGYAAGARDVHGFYTDQQVMRTRIELAPDDGLGWVPEWQLDRLRSLVDAQTVYLAITNDPRPQLFDDLEPGRVARAHDTALRALTRE